MPYDAVTLLTRSLIAHSSLTLLPTVIDHSLTTTRRVVSDVTMVSGLIERKVAHSMTQGVKTGLKRRNAPLSCRVGQRFGHLVAVRRLPNDAGYNQVWEFTCDCGGRHESRLSNVTYTLRTVDWASCKPCYFASEVSRQAVTNNFTLCYESV